MHRWGVVHGLHIGMYDLGRLCEHHAQYCGAILINVDAEGEMLGSPVTVRYMSE